MSEPLRWLLGLAVAGVLAWATPAGAQSGGVPPSRTKLMVSEEVVREVEQDTLVAIVTARRTAASPAEAQSAVNGVMAEAIERAEAVEDVRRSTGGYRVYQEHDRDGQATGWVAEQDLRLIARDAGPLLELVGALQTAGLALQGLDYMLSREARRALEDELTVEALANLRKRAERVAEAMAMRVEAIETIRLGGVGGEPPMRPMMRMAEAAAASAPPVALPDVETVRLNVDAEVVLSPR